jgi:hypothetical protein
MNRWDADLQRRLPPHFPKLTIEPPPRHFPTIPEGMERDLVKLDTVEWLLSDPDCSRGWWEPLRRNPNVRPANLPAHITVRYGGDGRPPLATFHRAAPPPDFDEIVDAVAHAVSQPPADAGGYVYDQQPLNRKHGASHV